MSFGLVSLQTLYVCTVTPCQVTNHFPRVPRNLLRVALLP